MKIKWLNYMIINLSDEELKLIIGALAFASTVDVSMEYGSISNEMVNLACDISAKAKLKANDSFYISKPGTYEDMCKVEKLKGILNIKNKAVPMQNYDFISSTAHAYDMDEYDVKVFYELHGRSNKFYECLEEFIKDRRNS